MDVVGVQELFMNINCGKCFYNSFVLYASFLQINLKAHTNTE